MLSKFDSLMRQTWKNAEGKKRTEKNKQGKGYKEQNSSQHFKKNFIWLIYCSTGVKP